MEGGTTSDPKARQPHSSLAPSPFLERARAAEDTEEAKGAVLATADLTWFLTAATAPPPLPPPLPPV